VEVQGAVENVPIRKRMELVLHSKADRARDETFKDWKRRFGETTMQKLGLTSGIKDENTGDIEVLLNR
jgi:hypothetical protein